MICIKLFLVMCVICRISVRSLPFTIEILDNKDILFPRRSELVKRTANNDVSEFNAHKISLASFIENIETGILHTALSVDPLASDSHAEVLSTSTPHPVERRSTKLEESAVEESSTPLVLVQKTEKVPAIDSIPSHVVIDRVSVFKAPEVGSGLFPTFIVEDTNISTDGKEVNLENNDEIDDNEEVSTIANNSNSSESEESTESNDSSDSSEEKSPEEKNSSTTEKESSTSTVSPSSSSPNLSSSSTTPLSVEDKKIVEKELKEKVVEVEADPVIFTARV